MRAAFKKVNRVPVIDVGGTHVKVMATHPIPVGKSPFHNQ